MCRKNPPLARAFTLVELLVVIGIIAVLIGVLLPVLGSAQRGARDVKCQSNMRQVCAALILYANENKGRFPPNVETLVPPAPSGQQQWSFWYDVERIGRYFRNATLVRLDNTTGRGIANSVTGGVMACPADEGGTRSYTMNYWASSTVTLAPPGAPARLGTGNWPKAGVHWGPHTKGASKLILLGEMYSYFSDGRGGYVTMTTLGRPTTPPWPPVFRPGIEFVGQGPGSSRAIGFGVRYSPTDSFFDWGRHRQRGERVTRYVEVRGRCNFGFADGHVAMYSPDDLADRATRRSKLVAWWSPLDDKVH